MTESPPANPGDFRDVSSISESGTSPGARNGNPFQYSCLGNPMDRGAWQPMVHRVAKSHTRLKYLSSHAQYVKITHFKNNM